MNLLEVLKIKEGFNVNECSVSDYILEHCEDIIHLSARELGRRTFTSSTVVVRFCKKLGYDSFSNFKVKLLVDFRTTNNDVLLEKEEHILSIMNKVSTKQQQTIERMQASVSIKDIKELHTLLLQSSYVDIIASDVNKAIAEYACHGFFSAGKIAQVYATYHLQSMLSMLADPKSHIVFLISKSGTTKELVNIAQELHMHDIFTIAFTSNVKSPLAKVCSMAFPCLFQDDFHSLQDMMFTESAFYLFNCIVAMLISYDYDYVTRLQEDYDQGYYKTHL